MSFRATRLKRKSIVEYGIHSSCNGHVYRPRTDVRDLPGPRGQRRLDRRALSRCGQSLIDPFGPRCRRLRLRQLLNRTGVRSRASRPGPLPKVSRSIHRGGCITGWTRPFDGTPPSRNILLALQDRPKAVQVIGPYHNRSETAIAVSPHESLPAAPRHAPSTATTADLVTQR